MRAQEIEQNLSEYWWHWWMAYAEEMVMAQDKLQHMKPIRKENSRIG